MNRWILYTYSMPQKISDSFVKPNDPVLMRIATEIPKDKIMTAETKKTVEMLLRIALGEQMNQTKPILVGLAAPQVGISKRIILVDIKADGKGIKGDLRVYINPVIISFSKENSEWYEGCFSTGGVCGIVSRPISVTIQAYTTEGERITEIHQGYTARIFQHEIDHLNGREFVSHIVEDSKLHWVEDDEFVEYRNNEKWRTWTNLCPRDRWLQVKGTK